MIPKHLAALFWDTNLETFDPRQHPAYTIARVLELGDQSAVAWMRAEFSEAAVTSVLRSERRLSPRSANFWSLVYRIPAGEIASLRT